MQKSKNRRSIILSGLLVLAIYSVAVYAGRREATASFPTVTTDGDGVTLMCSVRRNMASKIDFRITKEKDNIYLDIFKPTKLDKFEDRLAQKLSMHRGLGRITTGRIRNLVAESDKKITLTLAHDPTIEADVMAEALARNHFRVRIKNPTSFDEQAEQLLAELHKIPVTKAIVKKDLRTLYESFESRPFIPLFVVSLVFMSMVVAGSRKARAGRKKTKGRYGITLHKAIVPAAIITIWFLPGLGILGKTISSVICFSITSLFIIDKKDTHKFEHHARFLLMIVLYSGFWVLYFQMYDSVLWYVKAYVDATELNYAVNGILGKFGININWFFDVEHVMVINASVIIIFQLGISVLIRKKRTLPTLIFGFAVATIGMALLAVSPNIWIFMTGIVLFSIGEIIAHPKFISYIGLISPADKKGTYMGYLSLHGVFGASVGGVLGARLYVHFVDNLNQPRTLWLIFSSIGVVTIISLIIYDKFLSPVSKEKSQ